MFSKHEFHYLNVPRIGAFAVFDSFDCTFKCLQIRQCLSLNLAFNQGTGGKLLCELLSNDKYRNLTDFKGNESSHHFSIKVSVVLFRHNLMIIKSSTVLFRAWRTAVKALSRLKVWSHEKLICNSPNTVIGKDMAKLFGKRLESNQR